MRRSRRIMAVLFLAAGCLQAEPSDKPTLAVMELRTSGIPQADADLLSDYLCSRILTAGTYTVIDRMQRKALLGEIEFSQSGCVEEECQLRIGKLLSANLIVVGSVGRLDTKYLWNLKIVEVETGRLVRSVSRQYARMGDMVDDGALIAELTGGAVAQAPAAVPVAGKEKTAVPAPSVPAAVASGKPAGSAESAEAALSRARWVNGALSFALPGLGQLQNGDAWRGWIYLGIEAAYLGYHAYLAATDQLPSNPEPADLLPLIVLFFGNRLVSAVDAVLTARPASGRQSR